MELCPTHHSRGLTQDTASYKRQQLSCWRLHVLFEIMINSSVLKIEQVSLASGSLKCGHKTTLNLKFK
jgi:hypothetical protein